MPDPLNLKVLVPALVTTVSTSLLEPVEVGWNPTAMSPDSPGARVLFCQADCPIRNSVLLARVAEVTTRSAVPVFLTLTWRLFLDPTVTSPKLTVEEGERLSCGTAVPAATPEPESMTAFVCGMPSASIATVPLLLPVEVGLKVTVTSWDFPTGTVMELVLTEYCPEPVPIEIFVTTRGAVPVLLIVNVSVCEVPTAMSPNDRLEGLIEMAGLPFEIPVPLTLIVLVPALVTTVRMSLLFPVEEGLNATAISPDSPGARVLFSQAEEPIRNSVRLASVTELTTRLAVPVFLTVILRLSLDPTGTSPKLIFDVSDRYSSGVPYSIPTPVIFRYLASASLPSTVILSLIVPDWFGVKVTLTVRMAPGSITCPSQS